MAEPLRFTVPEECGGMVAKWFLKSRCGLSTRMITRLKREKDGILMDGKILRTIDRVTAGAEIIINLPDESSSFIEPIEGSLDIRYEDEHILVVNKPPFMPVHPVKQHQTNTLANLVTAYAQKNGAEFVFRAHNRLDRNTSGLVLIAKDKYSVFQLHQAMRKVYFALVHGRLEGRGTINKPIGLHDDSKIVRHVVESGSPAITHYKSVFSGDDYSLILLVLETGKTHQIRCHMSHLGHPLLGDDLYGGSLDLINRQALHCGEMSFCHPVTGEEINISAPIPDDMQTLIDKLIKK